MPVAPTTREASLLPPGVDFIRRDPALPGLATVLDPGALVRGLCGSLGRNDLRLEQVTYVKYKPAAFCRAGYRLQIAGTPIDLYATAYGPDGERELRWTRYHLGVPGALGVGRVVLGQCAAVVSFFPNDRKIKRLRAWAEPAARKKVLRDLLPGRPDLWKGAVESLAYKPERRYVARLCGNGGVDAVLKVFSRKQYPAVRATAGAFAPRGILWLPRLLGSSDRHAALAFEWLPGRVLSEALADPQFEPAALSDVGRALAQLHAQEPRGLPHRPPGAEATALGRVAEAFASLYPPLAGRVREAARRLGAALTDGPPVSRALHGDFNTTQVLLADGRVAFLDCDRALWGDPALDLGNFLAHLEREALASHAPATRVQAAGESLLEGYGSGSDLQLRRRVQRYTAAMLFEGLNPLRYWRPSGRGPDVMACWLPHWPELAEALLGRVEGLLGATGACSRGAAGCR